MEELFKNSLTGHMREKLGELGALDLSADVDKNPLAIHIENFDIENSPFGNLKRKEAQNPIKEQKDDSKKVVQKRLNDYDFNILQDSAFVDIEDIELSNEEKAEKIKNLIKQTEKKLFLIEGRGDSKLKEQLIQDKRNLESILQRLQPVKKSSVMDNEIKNINAATQDALKRIQAVLPKTNPAFDFICKLFPKIHKGLLMKKALNKLNALNQTATELINKKIPYGESDQRYDALIEYLSSANTIHAKLIKKI